MVYTRLVNGNVHVCVISSFNHIRLVSQLQGGSRRKKKVLCLQVIFIRTKSSFLLGTWSKLKNRIVVMNMFVKHFYLNNLQFRTRYNLYTNHTYITKHYAKYCVDSPCATGGCTRALGCAEMSGTRMFACCGLCG